MSSCQRLLHGLSSMTRLSRVPELIHCRAYAATEIIQFSMHNQTHARAQAVASMSNERHLKTTPIDGQPLWARFRTQANDADATVVYGDPYPTRNRLHSVMSAL